MTEKKIVEGLGGLMGIGLAADLLLLVLGQQRNQGKAPWWAALSYWPGERYCWLLFS